MAGHGFSDGLEERRGRKWAEKREKGGAVWKENGGLGAGAA